MTDDGEVVALLVPDVKDDLREAAPMIDLLPPFVSGIGPRGGLVHIIAAGSGDLPSTLRFPARTKPCRMTASQARRAISGRGSA
jgi:hypothetical protein